MLRSNAGGRGSSILEFVLTLPFAVLLLFITMDTGKAVFVKTSLQSAAAAAATIGARSGTIGNATKYTGPCTQATQTTGQNQADSLIFQSLCRAAPWESMGAEIDEVTVTLVPAANSVVSGRSSTVCTKEFPYVRVRVKAKMLNMLVPGISRNEGGFGLTVSSLLDSVEVESTVLCEVYRE